MRKIILQPTANDITKSFSFLLDYELNLIENNLTRIDFVTKEEISIFNKKIALELSVCNSKSLKAFNEKLKKSSEGEIVQMLDNGESDLYKLQYKILNKCYDRLKQKPIKFLNNYLNIIVINVSELHLNCIDFDDCLNVCFGDTANKYRKRKISYVPQGFIGLFEESQVDDEKLANAIDYFRKNVNAVLFAKSTSNNRFSQLQYGIVWLSDFCRGMVKFLSNRRFIFFRLTCFC